MHNEALGAHPTENEIPPWDSRSRQHGPYAHWVKPVLDRFLGLLLLVLSIPIMIFACLAVLLTMGRPVIYKQQRVGLDGNVFDLYKIRTMVPDRRRESAAFLGEDRRQRHKSPGDPRTTPVGRVLRAYRLDELPQFWNVLIGDLSLVGPRPEMPEIVDRYDPWQHRRHEVKPGITGPWQISERNGKLMHECTSLDLDYIERVSLREDLSILMRTPQAMFGARRGY